MLFCTSLVALVGAPENQPNNSPRRLHIVNTKVSRQMIEIFHQEADATQAAIHHLRAALPHVRTERQDESQTVDRGA